MRARLLDRQRGCRRACAFDDRVVLRALAESPRARGETARTDATPRTRARKRHPRGARQPPPARQRSGGGGGRFDLPSRARDESDDDDARAARRARGASTASTPPLSLSRVRRRPTCPRPRICHHAPRARASTACPWPRARRPFAASSMHNTLLRRPPARNAAPTTAPGARKDEALAFSASVAACAASRSASVLSARARASGVRARQLVSGEARGDLRRDASRKIRVKHELGGRGLRDSSVRSKRRASS